MSGKQRSRELRRRVMLRARLRASSGWSDTCILNVSSRGLMIHAAGSASKGSTIELWHGEHRIVATVVWRKGSQAGLRTEEPVPVEDILALGSGPSLQLTAGPWPQVDRRKAPRTSDDARPRGRAIEFAGIGIIAASLAIGVSGMVEEALAKPLGTVVAALSR